MSIKEQIYTAFPDVALVLVDKNRELNGEPATNVVVFLKNNIKVTGTFATEAKPGFGGVDFSVTKDIAGLMISKINSVLRGTAE